jgi:carboxymethylenebutenolidase
MGELIELPGTGSRAWRCLPTGPARGAVVIVQEIFGVNAHIRGVAERYAAHGWNAAAPLLFDLVAPGTELDYDATGVARGRELVAEIGFERALAVVDACARTLAPGARAGVVGYCWGGSLALLAATRLGLPAVSYYGGRSQAFLGEPLTAPLMLHYGRRDPLIPPEHVAAQRAAFPTAEVHEYDAGHGFNCEARADFDSAASETAFQRTQAFLERHLG